MSLITDKQQWTQLARKNAHTIEKEITRLRDGHWRWFERQYHEIAEHIDDLWGMFKTLKPLLPEDRERLWSQFCEAKAEIKRAQQKERADKESDSAQKRDIILSIIEDAEHKSDAAETRDDLQEATALLSDAREKMKDGWDGFNATTQILKLSPGRLLPEDRDMCWNKLKDVEQAIKSQRQNIWDRYYRQLHSKASDALNMAHQGDPKEAKELIKEIQTDLRAAYLNRVYFEEIKHLLDEAWQTALGRLKERHDQWVEKMEENIQRWRSRIEHNENFIARLEEQIEDCREKEDNARSSEFAELVRGWIEEKSDKINEVQEQIRELEEKIASVQSKLRN